MESPQGREVVMDGRRVLLFCSNSYLGLNNEPEILRAAARAIEEFGVGAGGSRLVSGNMDWTPPDTWTALGQWMRSIPASLPQRPKAQLVFSAHWEGRDFTLLSTSAPGLYYDYYDFPPHTYELQWPAPPAPELFDRVRQCMRGAGLTLAEDAGRDFDHGVFVPGLLMFPQADVPTLQISLRRGLDPAQHLALGAALAPLRDEGVLFVGSGMIRMKLMERQ